MNKLLGVMVLALLGGCASSVEDLAKDGNWYQVGYQDGIRGVAARSMDNLSRLGNVDTSDYDQGYMQGIDEYCNPEAAYQIGLSGQFYEGVCDGTEDAQRFRLEWQRGWEASRSSY